MLPVHNPQRRALQSDIEVHKDPKTEPDFEPTQEQKPSRSTKTKPDDG